MAMLQQEKSDAEAALAKVTEQKAAMAEKIAALEGQMGDSSAANEAALEHLTGVAAADLVFSDWAGSTNRPLTLTLTLLV